MQPCRLHDSSTAGEEEQADEGPVGEAGEEAPDERAVYQRRARRVNNALIHVTTTNAKNHTYILNAPFGSSLERHFSLSRSIVFIDFLDDDSSFHLQGGATSVHHRANETPVSVRLPRTRADGAKTRGRVFRS